MASEIAKAYVQLVPTTKGFGSALSSGISGDVTKAGTSAGTSFGNSVVSKFKGIIAAAGIGAILKEAFSAGADLEQSMGGVETLYDDAAQSVKDYAYEAQKAGLSANQYMEQAVSMGAALKKSLGGDSVKAAQAANTAIMDMTDNAAKMGTSVESLQNAYTGFSRANFTMLDNLSLGYSGTKEGMQQLLKDAQAISGIEYNIDSYSDIVEAIHVVQNEMGIAGTAAEEGAKTFSGSMAAMKSAATNFLADLTTGGDVQKDLQTLLNSVTTFIVNNLGPMAQKIVAALPMVLNTLISFITQNSYQMVDAGMKMITNLVQGLTSTASTLGPNLADIVINICDGLLDNLPEFIDAALDMILALAQGLIEALPKLIAALPEIINKLIASLLTFHTKIATTGVKLFVSLIKNLPAIITSIVKAIPKIITAIVKGWMQGVSQMASVGKTLLKAVGNAMAGLGSWLKSKVVTVAKNVINGFKSILSSVKDIGLNLVKGLWEGIKSAKDWIFDKIGGFCDGIVDGFKDFFGIHSPSRVMASQVGQYISSGMAEGITDNIDSVTNAMSEVTDAVVNPFDTTTFTGRGSYTLDDSLTNTAQQYGTIIGLLEKYLPNIGGDILLDGDTLVGRTASRMDKALGNRTDQAGRGVIFA